jgi:hypothetical protein
MNARILLLTLAVTLGGCAAPQHLGHVTKCFRYDTPIGRLAKYHFTLSPPVVITGAHIPMGRSVVSVGHSWNVRRVAAENSCSTVVVRDSRPAPKGGPETPCKH